MGKYQVWCEECEYREDVGNSRDAWQSRSRHATLTGHHVFAVEVRKRLKCL